MTAKRRRIDLVVLSDIHLGTYGCHAKELVQYLKSIQPKTLILNGDIVDIWQFRKRYFPADHLKVLKHIFRLASQGTEVIYITGNHDEALRRFTDFSLGNVTLTNKWVMNLAGGKAWFFHGDVFDASIQNAKWIAKLGGWGYDLLILFKRFVNLILERMGKEKYSLSKRIKNSVKKAVKFIGDFERTASELAIDQGYTYVVCGHIHQPQLRRVKNEKGTVTYLNSGDWIENLSALEYHRKKWRLYHHPVKNKLAEEDMESVSIPDFKHLLQLITPGKN